MDFLLYVEKVHPIISPRFHKQLVVVYSQPSMENSLPVELHTSQKVKGRFINKTIDMRV